MTRASTLQLAWLDRLVRALGRHWLFVLNSLVALYAALPWAAPLLQNAGYKRTGQLIFQLYDSLCHQLPERSFFVGGYQVCYCHRCVALYSTVAVVGAVYGLFRWATPLPSRLLLVAAIPIAVDVAWHIADDLLPGLQLRSAVNGVGSINFALRMVTGGLFGLACSLWLYPRLRRQLAPIEALV